MQASPKSPLRENIISNYLTVIWTAGLSLALLPFYLRSLGSEQWGVVALCITAQGFFGLLDAGLNQIMPRDVARVAGDKNAEARVFEIFSRAYIALALAGFFMGQGAVAWLVGSWLSAGSGLAHNAELAMRLVFIQFFFQFSNNAHTGYWNGIQAQRRANIRGCVFSTARQLCGLALVTWWRPDALAYLAPFVLFSAVEWLTNRIILRAELGPTRSKPQFADFAALARDAGMVASGVLVGILLSQTDRLVLSRVVDVSAYGQYIVVANLGLAFMQLQYPLMRALFPRVVQSYAGKGRSNAMRELSAVTLLCVVPCLIAALLAPWGLRLWLRDESIVAVGTPVLRMVLGAVAINALYHTIYQRILASGAGRVILAINGCSLLISLPVTITLAHSHGVAAGGAAWLLISCLQLLFGSAWAIWRRAEQHSHTYASNSN